MLKIRLQRIGKKNRPHYRLVVSEKNKDMYGDHKEIVGHYDPIAQPKVTELKEDRIKYWLSVGAQASPTVHNLLVGAKVVESKKVRAWTPKKKEATEGDAAPEAAAPKAEPVAEEPAKPAESPAEDPAEKPEA